MRTRVQSKEERAKPRLVDPNKPPEVAEVIANDGRRDGPRRRFESKFIKDIRAMMEGHAAQRLKHYLAAIEHRRYLLLKEKLRRLKAKEASCENGSGLKGRDLFLAQQEQQEGSK